MDDLLQKGVRRLEWARAHMGVLADVRERLAREQTLKGLRIGMALHVEAKTGMLALTLKEAGAQVRLASCNPLSTDDSVSLALREHYGLETYAKKGESSEEYYSNLNAVLDMRPDFVIDDGADLITLLHTTRRELLDGVKGGNEETTTGVMRLRAMAEEGMLRFPVISVNDAHMKYLFDNRYGTGQSTFDGFMNATNLLIAGKRLVVAGYGWCGRGIAMRAKGLGASVIVTEVNPVRAIEAKMDGFEVMPMLDASGRRHRDHRHRQQGHPAEGAHRGPQGRRGAGQQRPLRQRGLQDGVGIAGREAHQGAGHGRPVHDAGRP